MTTADKWFASCLVICFVTTMIAAKGATPEQIKGIALAFVIPLVFYGIGKVLLKVIEKSYEE